MQDGAAKNQAPEQAGGELARRHMSLVSQTHQGQGGLSAFFWKAMQTGNEIQVSQNPQVFINRVFGKYHPERLTESGVVRKWLNTCQADRTCGRLGTSGEQADQHL